MSDWLDWLEYVRDGESEIKGVKLDFRELAISCSDNPFISEDVLLLSRVIGMAAELVTLDVLNRVDSEQTHYWYPRSLTNGDLKTRPSDSWEKGEHQTLHQVKSWPSESSWVGKIGVEKLEKYLNPKKKTESKIDYFWLFVINEGLSPAVKRQNHTKNDFTRATIKCEDWLDGNFNMELVAVISAEELLEMKKEKWRFGETISANEKTMGEVMDTFTVWPLKQPDND